MSRIGPPPIAPTEVYSVSGDDNITVVVIRIEGLGERSGTTPEALKPRPEPQVLVEYDTDDASYSTFSRNLRIDGIFLETSEPISEGESLMMNISATDNEISVMVSGLVVGRSPKGIEITFEDLTAVQLETLKALVRNL